MDSLQPQHGQNEPDKRIGSINELCASLGSPFEFYSNAQTYANQPVFNHRLIFKFIKAEQFMPAYCPGVTNYKQKIAGTNRGWPVRFTEADKEAIRTALARMLTDLLTTP